MLTEKTLFSRPSRLTAVLALTMIGMSARAEDAVLVPGNPALTTAMTDKTAEFFEWALDVHFTPEQAGQYRAMVIRDWSAPQKRKSTLEFLPVIDKLWASTPETRDRVKAQFSRDLLDSLGKNRNDDEESRWLLAIYDGAHRVSVAHSISTGVNSGSAARVLTGKWRSTSVAATQYQNSYTGAPAPTSGNSFFYEFRSDGTYQNNNLMQITTYGCTSSVYGESSGRYRVEGNHLYVEPARGTVRSQVCGGHPSEKPDNLTVREYIFSIENVSGRETLVVNGLDGKTRPDYFRREAQ